MTFTIAERSYLLLLVQSDLNRMRIETDHARAYGAKDYKTDSWIEAVNLSIKLKAEAE